MSISKDEYEKAKEALNAYVDNVPDLQAMIEAGLLTYKSGWYVAKNKEAVDAIGRYATTVGTTEDGKAQFKIKLPSKQKLERMRNQVKKL